jgi:hypothetical protein
MSRRITSILVLTVLVLMWAGGTVSAVQDEWQYFKELTADSQGLALIRLDAEAMQNCQENFADIRITDQQGKEIPCQVIRPGQTETVLTVNSINPTEYEDGTAIMFDVGGTPHPHNQLVLNLTQNGDYMREVQLLDSDDANNWGTLGTSKIFSYQNEYSNKINFPVSTKRYLLAIIRKQPGESSLPIKSAQVLFLPNLYEGKQLPVSVVSNHSNQNTTEIVVDLGIPNYMITRLEIQSSDRNYDRSITVYSSDKAKVTEEKSLRVSGRIMAYDFNNYALNEDSVTVEQFCGRYLLLLIQNGDSPPLDIQAVNVYGAAPAFIAELSAPGILWYGNPNAVMPSYDLKEYANLINKTNLPVAEAGAQQINPDYRAPVVPWTEKNKWLLDTAIVLTAGIFVVIIIRMLKQLKGEMPEGQERQEEQ